MVRVFRLLKVAHAKRCGSRARSRGSPPPLRWRQGGRQLATVLPASRSAIETSRASVRSPPPHSPSTILAHRVGACLADDSQWINGRRNDAGWLPGLLPETTLGWIVTVLAIAGILVLLQRRAEPAFAAGGQQLGSASSTAAAGPLPWGRPPAADDLASSREAREKREAFLRRFDNTEKRQ